MHALGRFRTVVRQRILYPIRRWLTLQHFTALIFILYALSFVWQPPAQFVALALFLNFQPLNVIMALWFVFNAARLFWQPVTPNQYQVAILPLFAYFTVVLWYTLSGQTATWSGVITTLMIYGFFALAGVPLPKDGSHDTG